MSPRKRGIHRDPDIVALIEAAGGLVDAKALIVNQARELNAEYRKWASGNSTPLDRLKQLASLRGLRVAPMEAQPNVQRDAAIFMNDVGPKSRGQVFYNPLRPAPRVAFSIAHEITHTFFPATSGGARFRELLDDDDEQPNELEQLCHIGAAELLMPIEEFQAAAAPEWSIRKIPRLCYLFGASFEATVFRLATAHPRIAVAGLARFRRIKSDEARLRTIDLGLQTNLFGLNLEVPWMVADPKYRRQSLHLSENCPKTQLVPFNKSFNSTSCLYRTAMDQIAQSIENLPIPHGMKGIMEAVDAPYQNPAADPNHPDVLFYWKAA